MVSETLKITIPKQWLTIQLGQTVSIALLHTDWKERDLPGLTKAAAEGQLESIVQDIETIVRSYVEKIFMMLWKLLQNSGYLPSQFSFWTVEIDETMFAVAQQHYTNNFPCQSRYGTIFLGKCIHWEDHIGCNILGERIPGITPLINKSIYELEVEMDNLGWPIAVDAGPSRQREDVSTNGGKFELKDDASNCSNSLSSENGKPMDANAVSKEPKNFTNGDPKSTLFS
ncbi:unnamed protein product [Ilex paraguariensis]|uniref:Transposase n=1 Tax=Ilex paraguariensis TaxID=185542 RepID=A0ABC8R7R2_9AQUA